MILFDEISPLYLSYFLCNDTIGIDVHIVFTLYTPNVFINPDGEYAHGMCHTGLWIHATEGQIWPPPKFKNRSISEK